MADVQKAIGFVLGLEDDHKYPGFITQLRGDTGGKTRLGIASRFHPDLVESGFFDGDPVDGATNPLVWNPTTIPIEEGEAIAEQTYEKEYTGPLRLASIDDQTVADEILSFAVNEGLHQGAVMAQRAAGVTPDGCFGPVTISAINELEPASFLALLKQEQTAFYAMLAATQPGLSEYARGMQDRANS